MWVDLIYDSQMLQIHMPQIHNKCQFAQTLLNQPHTSQPTNLSSLLRIKEQNSPSQAACIKIIKAHFSGGDINTQVFNHMELNVHPSAIAWMGGSKTNDLLFAFLRSMPSVCDTKRKIKKRKAVDDDVFASCHVHSWVPSRDTTNSYATFIIMSACLLKTLLL